MKHDRRCILVAIACDNRAMMRGAGLYGTCVFFAAMFLVAGSVHAETRIAEQLLTDATVDQAQNGFNNYAAQTFTPSATGTLLSIVLPEHACDLYVGNGWWNGYKPFTYVGPVAGGYKYSGSYDIQPGTRYIIVHRCNPSGVPIPFIGTTVDSYAGGEAGHSSLDGVTFKSNLQSGNTLMDWAFTACTTIDCTLLPVPCSQDCNSNVLFIPGTEASRLYDTENGETELWEPHGDTSAQKLAMNPDGTSVRNDIYTRDVFDNVYVPLKGNIYQSFIADMNALKAAGTIHDWAPAPYDWRYSLDQTLSAGTKTGANISFLAPTSTPFIESELRRLAASSKSGKVTIIAHSNGGLVTKALLHKLGDEETARLVDKVILVASPQVGTPQAIAGLLHGYNQAMPAEVFPHALSDAAARAVGDTMPGLYTLLPSGAYMASVSDPVATFSTTSLTSWAQKYGDSITSPQAEQSFLADATRGAPSSTQLLTPSVLNSTFVSQALAAHDTLDSWTPPPGVRVIQIAGWGIPTTVSGVDYAQTFEDGKLIVAGSPRFVIDGDGTVVTPSALWMSTSTDGVERYWVDLRKYSNDHWIQTTGGVNGWTPFTHANILEVANLRDFIGDMVASTTQPLATYTYLKTFVPSGPGTLLRYALHSPLTLNLYDDQGRHTGISTTTGEVDQEIPGTYYAEFGGVKYLFTGAASSSHLVMNGYAIGVFTLNVDEYQGDTRVASTTFANVPTTPNTAVTLDTQSDISTLSPLSVDENSDGTPDLTITPVPDGAVNLDTAPPATTAVVAGILGLNGWYVSTSTVTFAATDDASGAASTFVSMDGAATTTVPAGQASITISTEGIHTIGYYSEDAAGNTEAPQYLSVKIDKTPPEATISFSTTTKSVLIAGSDTMSSTTVLTTIPGPTGQATSTVADASGRRLVIVFSKLVPTGSVAVSISSLVYDGATTTLPTNSLTYSWTVSKTSSSLSEKSTIKGQSCVSGSYSSKTNQTTISYNLSSDSCSKGTLKKMVMGVDVISVKTDKGSLKVSY